MLNYTPALSGLPENKTRELVILFPDMAALTKVLRQPAMPGEWQHVDSIPNVDERFAKMFPIVLSCPQCGKLCSVSARNHQVTFHDDATFSASPSFVCPHAPCTWHVFISHSEY